MATFESESVRNIDKFNGENFGLWKFCMEMVLLSMDLWEIVDKSVEARPKYANPKVIKNYNQSVKKAMSVIELSLVDGQLVHIKSYKGPV